MAIRVRHTRVSTKPVGGDPSKIQAEDWNADHEVTGSGLFPIGTIIDYVGVDIPAGWLECAGQALSAAAYPELFAKLVKSGTVTITQPASPAVISWTAHGRRPGDIVAFQSTGVLPGGIITADLKTYRIISAGFSVNAFRISETWEGPAVATVASPAQTGIHTGIHAPYGVSTGLTTFAIPDFRSVVLAGITNMNGTQSSKLGSGYQMGHDAGAETVTITVPNLPPHDHSLPMVVQSKTDWAVGTVTRSVPVQGVGATGLGLGTATPINKMQPTTFVKKLIHTGI